MKPLALVVDENVKSLKRYRRTLEKYGFDVLTTSFPKDVIQIIEENYIDCIHLDIHFENGEIDGFDVINAVKNKFRKIPVIFIYSDISKRYSDKAKMIGFNDSIKRYEKSYDYDIVALEILKLINDHISNEIIKAVTDYITSLPINKDELLASVLKNKPPIVRIIDLKPTLLLDKLEEILKLIENNIDKSNYRKIATKYFSDFKDLVLRCLRDYFSDALHTHNNLADHLLEFCSYADIKAVNDFLTKATIEALYYIINSFKNKTLTEEVVYLSKTYLTEASGIKISSLSANPEDFEDNFMDDYVD